MAQRTTPKAGSRDWVVCRGCRRMVYARRLADDFKVCPECGSHHPLTAVERLEQLLDPGSARPLDLVVEGTDPLGFADSRAYPQRWEAARASTGLAEAVLVARGRVEGTPLVAAVMDFRFMGGTLGSAVGELVTVAAETALRDRVPLLLVTASGGARMQEGPFALMQMAKTAQVLRQLDQAGILTVTLVTDPTYGGVAASFATLTDVILAEPGARLGFAGPRVIPEPLRRNLPAGFQTAELLLRQGLIDAIHPRHTLRPALGRLLSAGSRRGGDDGSPADPAVLVTDPRQLPEVDGWTAVQRARALDRPTTLDHLSRVVEDFEELRGDRIGGDCPAIVGGLARLAGTPVVVVGHQKGHTPAELAARNYGMAGPAGYRKAARLFRLAAKLGLPVLTLVDTPGAHPGPDSEEHGQSAAIAELIGLMSGLPVPVVTVITGEGGSGGALALAVADRVLISAHGTYSVISPEGCSSILWGDGAAAPRAAGALRLDARSLLADGIVDGVVPEPPGGSGADPAAAAGLLRDAVVGVLRELCTSDPGQLLTARYDRFRRYGAEVVHQREAEDDDDE